MPSESDPFAIIRSRSPLCSGRDPADATAAESSARVVAQSGTLIKRVREDAGLLSLLAPHGFGDEALAAGGTLLEAAEAQIGAAVEAGDAHVAALARREELWITAREEYLEFRATVRSEFRERALHRLLGVVGTIAADLSNFVGQASASYRAAASTLVAAPLARRSFDHERIANAREVLEQLVGSEQLVAATHATWRRAVEERELAAQMLALWTSELVKTMRLAFGRTHRPPDVAGTLRAPQSRSSGAGRTPMRKLGPPPAP